MNGRLCWIIQSGIGFRPQQGLTIMNDKALLLLHIISIISMFPSPTGVNHYECCACLKSLFSEYKEGFRPQQGLTIMNNINLTKEEVSAL